MISIRLGAITNKVIAVGKGAYGFLVGKPLPSEPVLNIIVQPRNLEIRVIPRLTEMESSEVNFRVISREIDNGC